eukprot:CAMPEP_0197394698 /NCGR_PEP_ID=MMETSP1165-20131217/5821_1 /TAXON_ID=284809 /ORGANISM="Chrysocystis fragilis, Strain CCMP3189" /LENGTH=188 /DNA_ID=CAMNT_0042920425 /DNA_START=21 /DNA_END=587 /DNA_ORIENTATION=-
MKFLLALLAPAAAFVAPQQGTMRLGALALAPGETVPMDGEFFVIDDGPTPLAAKDVFAGKTVVVFGIPGALTPTCTEKQLPGFVAKAADFKAKGVDTVACLAVNDPFVMREMAKAQDPDGAVVMLGDGAATFVTATGLSVDTGGFGGVRCQRCSFLVKDGVVEVANLEGGTGFTDVSSAETILGQIAV